MRKLVLNIVLTIFSTLAIAQTPFKLVEGESAIVYSLPKTELIITIETENVTQKPGAFFRYSERYLATNKVIKEEKTNYKLKSIAVKAHAIPDLNRTFSILPIKKSALNYISVDYMGLLCGVNTPSLKSPEDSKLTQILNKESEIQQLLPLGEEYMMAGSEAKLAEGAAKQIYRIRESRLALLTADLEKLPADGESLKSMLKGLDTMEKNLTELFIGTTSTVYQTHILKYTPESAITNQTLFRLSALRGVVSADDLSGEPYTISIKPLETTEIKASEGAKSQKVGIYTIYPLKAELTIQFGNKTIYTKEYQLPQLGKLIPLNESLFANPKTKVQIDKETGRLLNFTNQ